MRSFSWTALAFVATTTACASEPAAPAKAPTALELGADVYSQNCVGCHGENGEGTEGRPALVGVRPKRFATALDYYRYVKNEMPPIAPGSLGDAEAWAVSAFVLDKNGVRTTSLADAGKVTLGAR